jgi:hypothetical protein
MMEVVIITCDDNSVSEVGADATGCDSPSVVKLEVEEGTFVVDSVANSSESASDSEDTDEEEDDRPKDTCSFCGQVPCDWDTFGDEIFYEGMELKESGLENNQVCYHAYRHYTHLRHGVYRKHDHHPLPVCAQTEIMENWPDPNRNYVGFQAVLKEAAWVLEHICGNHECCDESWCYDKKAVMLGKEVNPPKDH